MLDARTGQSQVIILYSLRASDIFDLNWEIPYVQAHKGFGAAKTISRTILRRLWSNELARQADRIC